MIPKTTQNLLKDFFSNIMQKMTLFLLSFFEKKIWLLPFKISCISLLMSNSSKLLIKSVFGIPQQKNRKIKSAPPEEVYYTLYILIY